MAHAFGEFESKPFKFGTNRKRELRVRDPGDPKSTALGRFTRATIGRFCAGGFTDDAANQRDAMTKILRLPGFKLAASEAQLGNDGGQVIRQRSADGKTDVSHHVSSLGDAMPLIALGVITAPGEAPTLRTPPPLAMLGQVVQSPPASRPSSLTAGSNGPAPNTGPLWRLHAGELYGYNTEDARFDRVSLPGHRPGEEVTMHGLQADGRVVVSAGSQVWALDAKSVAVQDLPHHSGTGPLAAASDGRLFGLRRDGLLNLESGQATALKLTDADGKETGLSGADIVQMKMLPPQAGDDPGAAQVVLRDRSGRVFQGRLGDDGVEARALKLPPGAAYEMCLTAGTAGQGMALNVAVHDSTGQRVGHVMEGGELKARWHLNEPVVLLNNDGLRTPRLTSGVVLDEHSDVAVTGQGTVVRIGVDGLPQRLNGPDGAPLKDVFDIKCAPLAANSMPGEMPLYAKRVTQRDGEFHTELVALELAGVKQSLRVDGPPALKAVPTEVQVTAIKPLLSTTEVVTDFAADSAKNVFVASGRDVTRHSPGGTTEVLDPLPVPARSIAVSSENNRLYALTEPNAQPRVVQAVLSSPSANGAPERLDVEVAEPTPPTLMRYDDAKPPGERWVDCRVRWRAGEDPALLAISRAGSLQVRSMRNDPESEGPAAVVTHRIVSPIEPDNAHVVAPYAGEAAHEQIRETVKASRTSLPGGRYATGTTTVGNVKTNFTGANAASLMTGALIGQAQPPTVGLAPEVVQALQPYAASRLAASTDLDTQLHDVPAVAHPLHFLTTESDRDALEASRALRGEATQSAQFALQKLAIYTKVLGRDQRPRVPGAAPVRPAPPADDRINQMLQRWTAIQAALEQVPTGSSDEFPLADRERGDVKAIVQVLTLMKDAGVKWSASTESGPKGRGRVGDVQLGAAERSLVTYEQALNLVTQAPPDASGPPPAARSAALADLQTRFAEDKTLAMMRYGVRNVDVEARGHIEAVLAHRRELRNPHSVMRQTVNAAFGVTSQTSDAELAQILADHVRKMPNRSMVYLVPEVTHGLGGSVLVPSALTGGVVGGSVTIQRERGEDPYLGIEKNGYGVVLYPFQDKKTAGIVDIAVTGLFDALRFSLTGSGSATESFGTALLCPHNQVDEFMRLYLSDEDPLKMLALGMKGANVGVGGPVQQHGAIGLNESSERVFNVAMRGGIDMRFFEAADGFAAAPSVRLNALVGYRFREVHVNLPSGYAPVEGEMNMGGQGLLLGAQAYAGLPGGALDSFDVSNPADVALRWMDVAAVGADAQVYAGGSYRRTLEWGPAPEVTEKDWMKLVDLAKTSFPSLGQASVDGADARQWLGDMLAKAKAGVGDLPATDDVARQKFIDAVQDLEVQDFVARQPGGGARLQANSRLELNVTYRLPDDMDLGRTLAHVGLGSLQSHALDPVKTVSHALRAMMTSEVNDVRLLFELDPAVLRQLNVGVAMGEWKVDDVERWLKTQPAIYRLSAIAPRNSGAMSAAVHLPLAPGVYTDVKMNMPAEWYNGMELKFQYGTQGIARADWAFDGARERLHEQPGVDYFARQGAPLLPQRLLTPPHQSAEPSAKASGEAAVAHQAASPGTGGTDAAQAVAPAADAMPAASSATAKRLNASLQRARDRAIAAGRISSAAPQGIPAAQAASTAPRAAPLVAAQRTGLDNGTHTAAPTHEGPQGAPAFAPIPPMTIPPMAPLPSMAPLPPMAPLPSMAPLPTMAPLPVGGLAGAAVDSAISPAAATDTGRPTSAPVPSRDGA